MRALIFLFIITLNVLFSGCAAGLLLEETAISAAVRGAATRMVARRGAMITATDEGIVMSQSRKVLGAATTEVSALAELRSVRALVKSGENPKLYRVKNGGNEIFAEVLDRRTIRFNDGKEVNLRESVYYLNRNANLYSSPTLGSENLIRQLDGGSLVLKATEVDGWYKVLINEAEVGYIQSSYLIPLIIPIVGKYDPAFDQTIVNEKSQDEPSQIPVLRGGYIRPGPIMSPGAPEGSNTSGPIIMSPGSSSTSETNGPKIMSAGEPSNSKSNGPKIMSSGSKADSKVNGPKIMDSGSSSNSSSNKKESTNSGSNNSSSTRYLRPITELMTTNNSQKNTLPEENPQKESETNSNQNLVYTQTKVKLLVNGERPVCQMVLEDFFQKFYIYQDGSIWAVNMDGTYFQCSVKKGPNFVDTEEINFSWSCTFQEGNGSIRIYSVDTEGYIWTKTNENTIEVVGTIEWPDF